MAILVCISPRNHTIVATATLEAILAGMLNTCLNSPEFFPLGKRLLRRFFLQLLSGRTKVCFVDDHLLDFGLTHVLVSNLSKIQRVVFPEYCAKKASDICALLFL